MKTTASRAKSKPAKSGLSGDCGNCRECHHCSNIDHSANRPPIGEMRSLSDVLAYKNTRIVRRIEKESGLSHEEASVLFVDMLRFLYLCATNRSKKRYSPTRPIDEAWHIFIIFTMDYAQFCNEYFGFFIHHRPFTDKDREAGRIKTEPLLPAARRKFGRLSKFWNPKIHPERPIHQISPHSGCTLKCCT